MKSVESKFKSVPSKSGLPFFLCCLIIACCSVTTAWAQVSRQEIKENVMRSGSNYYAYPGPQGTLTKAPKGYKPYYITDRPRQGCAEPCENDYQRGRQASRRTDTARG